MDYYTYLYNSVSEDWCYMPGKKTKMNGVKSYNTLVRSILTICVSLKSDEPERTLQHDLEHEWRNAVTFHCLQGHIFRVETLHPSPKKNQ